MRIKKAVLGPQLREFIACVDVLAERLAPKRRRQDRKAPECSPQELRALTALGRTGTLAMSDLAGILKVPLSTATRTIDKLVGKGLVERKRAKEDRRIVHVVFSKEGKQVNRFVVESRISAGRAMLAALQPAARKALIAQMGRMIRAFKS